MKEGVSTDLSGTTLKSEQVTKPNTLIQEPGYIDPTIKKQIENLGKEDPETEEETVEPRRSEQVRTVRTTAQVQAKNDLKRILEVRNDIQITDPMEAYALRLGNMHNPGVHKQAVAELDRQAISPQVADAKLAAKTLEKYREEIEKRKPKPTITERIKGVFEKFLKP